MTPTEIAVLEVLASDTLPMSAPDIWRRTSLTRAGATRGVNALQRRGLVEWLRASTSYGLTEEGRRAAEDLAS